MLQPASFLSDAYRIRGSILSLLHSHHLGSRDSPSILLPPQTRQGLDFRIKHRVCCELVANAVLDIEDTAPRIKSNFKPADDALIQGQKRKQWRRERRLKRIITVAVGWSAIALMLYLIAVTKVTVAKIWDPYDILEISRVRRDKPDTVLAY